MKKSQLRNIIQESIKGLMTEQGTNTSYPSTPPAAAAYVRSCTIGNASFNTNFSVDGAVPQGGQIFQHGSYAGNDKVFVSTNTGQPYDQMNHLYGNSGGGLIPNPNHPCPPNQTCNSTFPEVTIKLRTSLTPPPGTSMQQFCPNICTSQGTSQGYGPNSPECSTSSGTGNQRMVQTLFCDGSHQSSTNTQDCSTLYPNVPHFANAPQGTQCTGVMNASFFHNMTINGQVPQLGDKFNFNAQLNGITGFPGGMGMITGNPGFFNSWFGDHVVVTVSPAYMPNTPTDYSSSSCPSWPPAPVGCPGCNGGNHVWGNMQNWQNNFDQIIANFIQNSANPLQPCLFLQQKIDQWTTVQAGVGNANAPCNAYWNQLECKIKYAEVLKIQHNC
mgnify:CR=1 FL=1